MMNLLYHKRNIKMSTIKNTRDIYNNIPKPEPPKNTITPPNTELLDKVVNNLNKNPQIAPKIK
jgi:hypothetical protein